MFWYCQKASVNLIRTKPLGCSQAFEEPCSLQKLYPDMEVKASGEIFRQRLRKLDDGEYSGLILAAAGLKRLGLEQGSAVILQ